MRSLLPVVSIAGVLVLMGLIVGLTATRTPRPSLPLPSDAPPDTPSVTASAAPVSAARAAAPSSRSLEPAPSRTAERSPERNRVRAGTAMVVAVDPETGALGPLERAASRLTIEELQGLARQEAEGLVTVRHPDGSESIDHEGRFATTAVVRVGTDGGPLFQCVEGEAGAKLAVREDTKAQPLMEEE